MKKILSVTMATALLIPSIIPKVAAAADTSKAQTETSSAERAQAAAINESENLALQMVLAAAMAEQKGADLTKVDEKILAKYNSKAKGFGFSVPIGVLGGTLSTYLVPQTLKTSAEFAGPLLQFVKPALVALWEGAKYSGRQVDAILTAIKFDVLIKNSSDAMESSYKNLIEPVLKLLISKNTVILSNSASSAGLLYTSVKFLTTDSHEAMTYEMIRNHLGQSDMIRGRVARMVSGLAPIMDLNADAQAKLQVAIYDEVLGQAIANQFSEDQSKYKLDIVDLMIKNSLISPARAEAVNKLRQITRNLRVEESTLKSSREVIASNLSLSLAIAATLESNINSGKITDLQTLSELQRLLGALSAQLTLIGFNLKQ